MQNLRAKAKLFLGWPLSALAFIFIIRFILDNSSKASFNIAAIKLPYFALGILCFASYFVLRSIVWGQIIKNYSEGIKFFDNLYLWVSTEIKRFVPGGIWSFLSRTSHYHEKGIDRKSLFKSLLIESETVIVSCAALSIPAFSMLFKILSHESSFLFTNLSVFGAFVLFILFVFGYKIPMFKKIAPAFGYMQNFKILLLGIITFLAWGTGCSLIALSIYPIPLAVSTLISIFTLALLIGYVSIITPMGLGVREAVAIVLLGPVVGKVDAAGASIFTRVILVSCELAFLGAILFLNKNERIRR